MALTTERPPITQFKTPRLGLVWRPASDTRASWKLGLVGFYFRETPRRLHIVFAARGALLWALALGFTAYLGAATALHYVWSRSPHNRVTFLDLALPTRWDAAKQKRGGDLIAQGIEEMRGRRYGTALLFLARGVSMAPADQRGRLELARLYMGAGYLPRAKQLLEDGLAYPPIARAYTDLYFAVANYMEDHEAVLAAVNRLAPDAEPRLRRDLLTQQANALRRLERWDELDQIRHDNAAAPLIGVEQAWAQSQLDRGTPAVALAALDAQPELYGLPAERADLESRLALAAGQFDRARTVAEAWRNSRPTDFGPRLLEVQLAIRENFWFTAREKIVDYLVAFGAQPTLTAQLFIRLGEIEDEQWFRLARQQAEEAGAFGPQARMVLVETLLNRGHFEEAQRELAAAATAMQAAKFNPGLWLLGVQRILDACRGTSPSARSLLLEFLTSERASPAGYHLALNALARSTAREVLADVHTAAFNRYPAMRLRESTRAAVALASQADPKPQVQLARRDPSPRSPRVTTHTATNPPVRTPAPAQKERAPLVLPPSFSDQARKDEQSFPTERVARSGLTRADQLIAEGNPGAALELLTQIERAGHNALRRDILLRRVRILGDRREFNQLLANIRLLLRETPLNQVELRALAETWRDAGQTDSALILLREITAASPGALWAFDLQRTINEQLKIQPPEGRN